MSSLPPTDRVRTAIRSLIGRLAGTGTFTDDQDVFTTGLIRSINLLELIVGVEDTWRLAVDERDVFEGKLRSVDALVALVRARGGRS